MKKPEVLCISFAILYFIIVSIYDVSLIQDYFSLQDHIEPQALYQTIISTISTILSLIAIIFLIYFQVLQDFTGSKAQQYFYKNQEFRSLILASSITTILSVISLMNVRHTFDNCQLSQLYFCSFLFFISLILVVPFVISFLKIGNPRKYTINLMVSI